MADVLKLKKNLEKINYLFFLIVIFFNVISFIFSKNLDFVYVIISLVVLFIGLLPYFLEFTVNSLALAFFLQGIGVIILSFFLSFKNPFFIFFSLLGVFYTLLCNIFKDGIKYSIGGLILFFIILLIFAVSDELFKLELLKNLKNLDIFNSFYFYFLFFSVSFLLFLIFVFSNVRQFILDYYKSQVIELVSAKMEEANKLAREKAKEAEERYRELLALKEKQEKIFEINANLAKKFRNIKSQLQYLAQEIKDMVFANGVAILFDKGSIISVEHYIDVPLPIVDVFRLSVKGNEKIKKFIDKTLRNKEIVHVNKRKGVYPVGINEEEALAFLQNLSKLTFEVYEVLLVPIVNSLNESLGLFVLFNNKDELFTEADKKIMQLMGLQTGIIIHNSLLIKKLEDTFYETINAFSSAIEAKDKYTPVLHTFRVGDLAYEIALEMGLSEDEAERIKIAGILHDVGKLAIPDSILAKQGPLTQEEREVIKTHSEEGSKILSKISFFREKSIHLYVLYHHERVDGKGYPKGLRGREIPLASNIISIADTYDAISTPRPYNKQYASEQKAIEIIKSERGRQFFEEVVDAFFRVLAKRKEKQKIK